MANARSRKREIDKNKREKAQLKRDRQRNPQPDGEIDGEVAEGAEAVAAEAPRSEEELLGSLQVLHQRFDDGELSFDDFEEAKAALVAQLTPD